MFPFNGGLNGDGFFGDEYGDTPNFNYSGKRRRSRNYTFNPDPLYYFKDVTISIENETKKAFLFRDDKGIYWIPKSLVRISQYRFMVWKKFVPKYLSR